MFVEFNKWLGNAKISAAEMRKKLENINVVVFDSNLGPSRIYIHYWQLTVITNWAMVSSLFCDGNCILLGIW